MPMLPSSQATSCYSVFSLSHLPCALSTLPCCFHCNPRQCEFFRQRHPWCFQKESATHKQRFEHTCLSTAHWLQLWEATSQPKSWVCVLCRAGGKTPDHVRIPNVYLVGCIWATQTLCVLVTCPAEHKADREPWSTKNLRGCLWSMQLWLTVSVQPATVLLGYGCSHLS